MTPNRMLQELDDEIGIGPFNKRKNYPFDKRGDDPFGSLYKLSMFGNKVFDALVSEPVPGDTDAFNLIPILTFNPPRIKETKYI